VRYKRSPTLVTKQSKKLNIVGEEEERRSPQAHAEQHKRQPGGRERRWYL